MPSIINRTSTEGTLVEGLALLTAPLQILYSQFCSLEFAPREEIGALMAAHCTENLDPLAFVWQETLGGIFSILGRMARLANLRDSRTGRYSHPKLAEALGSDETDRAIRVTHELLWKDWLRGSLEQQHADVLFFLHDLAADVDRLIALWLESRPFLEYVPDSAPEHERVLFISNLKTVLALMQNQYASNGLKAHLESRKVQPSIVNKVIGAITERYADPNLSLVSILGKTARISPKRLGRLFHEATGQTFRQYLREVRLNKAAARLASSDYEIKSIAAAVGYKHRSHFSQDFRALMGCTPVEYRATGKSLLNR